VTNSYWGNKGIYKSTDNGVNWKYNNFKYFGSDIDEWFYIGKDDEIYYNCASALPSYESYKTTDYGSTWQMMRDTFMITPTKSGDLFACVYDTNYDHQSIYSSNNGKTWKEVNFSVSYIYDLRNFKSNKKGDVYKYTNKFYKFIRDSIKQFIILIIFKYYLFVTKPNIIK